MSNFQMRRLRFVETEVICIRSPTELMIEQGTQYTDTFFACVQNNRKIPLLVWWLLTSLAGDAGGLEESECLPLICLTQLSARYMA